MRRFISTLIFFSISCLCVAQKRVGAYNDSLAKALGADDYGMRSYILVMLKTGPNKTENKSYTDSCFAGHMKNMAVMEAAGQLVVAGPLKKNDKLYRGIFILDVKDKEAAAKLLLSDPAVNGGLLEPELYDWYGSAALPLYLKEAHHISKKSY